MVAATAFALLEPGNHNKGSEHQSMDTNIESTADSSRALLCLLDWMRENEVEAMRGISLSPRRREAGTTSRGTTFFRDPHTSCLR